MRSNVNQRLLDWDVLLFDELSPSGDIWHSLHGVSPLSAEETTGRVFEIKSEQEGILLIVVQSVDIRAETESLDKSLPESVSIHLFCEVAMKELVFTLRVLIVEQLLERL